ncbi:MAG: UPF0175 family protein [Candidatus Micrarchaeota archaeon]
MKNTTYISLPDVVRQQAQLLIDAGLYSNMSEFIREAVRRYVQEQKITNVELAVELYEREKVSLGKAAGIAGLTYDEMLDALYLRGIEPKNGPVSQAEAQAELKKAKRLL